MQYECIECAKSGCDVHLQYVSMGIYRHEFDILKKSAEMLNWFQNVTLVMDYHYLNILQMDKSQPASHRPSVN